MGGIARVAAVAAACLLAGCGTTSSSNIEIGDRVSFSDLRISGSFAGGETKKLGLKPGGGFEVYATRARGSDIQRLTAGEPPVRFMGHVFDPPGEPHLQHEFDFDFLSISYRYLVALGKDDRMGGPAWLEFFGGPAKAEANLRMKSVMREASGTVGSTGAAFGYGLIYLLNPATALQGRASMFIGKYGEGNMRSALRLELFFARALGNHLALRAGYAGWKLTSEGHSSKIHLNLHGPALGLELNF
jgi:hypothetical protein